MSDTATKLAAEQERWERRISDEVGICRAIPTLLKSAQAIDARLDALAQIQRVAEDQFRRRLTALETAQVPLTQGELADAILDLRERVVALETAQEPAAEKPLTLGDLKPGERGRWAGEGEYEDPPLERCWQGDFEVMRHYTDGVYTDVRMLDSTIIGGFESSQPVERVPADPAPAKPTLYEGPLGGLGSGKLHTCGTTGVVWLKTREVRDDGAICCYAVGDRDLDGRWWSPPETFVREVPLPAPGDEHA